MSPGLAESKETDFHTREEGRKPAFTTRFTQRNPGGSQTGDPPFHHLSQTTSLGWSRCRAGLLTHGSTYSPRLPGKIPVACVGFVPVHSGGSATASNRFPCFPLRESRQRCSGSVHLGRAPFTRPANQREYTKGGRHCQESFGLRVPTGLGRRPGSGAHQEGRTTPDGRFGDPRPLLPDLDEPSPRY